VFWLCSFAGPSPAVFVSLKTYRAWFIDRMCIIYFGVREIIKTVGFSAQLRKA